MPFEFWDRAGGAIEQELFQPSAEVPPEAHIDHIDPAGILRGWARDPAGREPAVIEIWLNGALVSRAIAGRFRQDLLLAGIGHGHYGFTSRFPARSAAPQSVIELRHAGQKAVLLEHRLATHAVPANPPIQTVESLVAVSSGWSISDIIAHLEVLELERNLAARGGAWLVAMIFKFLLARWPTPQELSRLSADLGQHRLSANECFIAVVNSEERQGLNAPLPGPHDAGFPFKLGRRENLANSSIPLRKQPANGAVMALLPGAVLVSPPWQENYDQLRYDPAGQYLLCHPPPSGSTVARLGGLPASGPVQAQVRVSVGNQLSHPIEFAMVILRGDLGGDAIMLWLQTARPEDIGWQRVAAGADRILCAISGAGPGAPQLYIATRMATDSPNHYYAWARFSNLLVRSGAAVGQPAAAGLIAARPLGARSWGARSQSGF